MWKLASSIGLALALADLKARVRRLVTQGILGTIGAVFFLIGFCFLLVAAHLFLSEVLNPIASAAIIGGVLIIVALFLFLLARLKGSSGSARSSAARPANTAEENMGRLGETFASTSLANPMLVAAGFALLVGFLFGRRSKRDSDD
jgi:hypothetical protein